MFHRRAVDAFASAKHRDSKPLAIMVWILPRRSGCGSEQQERELLTGIERRSCREARSSMTRIADRISFQTRRCIIILREVGIA
jgi:hypothetical protein